MEWTSVKDELPAMNREVLVWDGSVIYTSELRNALEEYERMQKKVPRSIFFREKTPPTHWMPFPEPPRGA